MIYELPKLEYEYNALEPYIDEVTMKIHHGKHHAGYVAKLNTALEGQTDLQEKPLEEILSSIDSVPEDIRVAVRNNGGGHLNHSLFWSVMPAQSNDGGEPTGELRKSIDKEFGSFSSFVDEFTKTALGRFGSGWAWLVLDKNRNLIINSTPNQDSPVMQGQKPILGLDLWEHAYYLNYQNKRVDYINAWWKVINWERVSENFKG